MKFFHIQHFAVATRWSGASILLHWALLVQVTSPEPQTTWRLFAISRDVTELLAVVTLRQSALGSVCLHLDGNVAEAWQTEYFLRLGGSR
jgi:hypothetical protein